MNFRRKKLRVNAGKANNIQKQLTKQLHSASVSMKRYDRAGEHLHHAISTSLENTATEQWHANLH
jgi:hypothetical protein